jgi:magnesium transporter
MFQVLDLGADGKTIERDGEAWIAPPRDGQARWVDLVDPDPASLELLRQRFDFHPLAIADCATFGTQSKLDDYERYLFIVIHSFTASPDDPLDIQIHEIHAFVGASYLVTVHDNPLPSHAAVWHKAVLEPHVLERGPLWILYMHVDAMVAATEPLVHRIRDQLDEIEWTMIEQSAPIDLRTIVRMKRVAVAMRRVIRPLGDPGGGRQRPHDGLISQRTMLHLRDVTDHVARLAEMVEEIREVSSGLVSSYQAFQAQKANNVMKSLTVFSAIFLPLSFIVGFFGQNFVDLPYDNSIWLGIMLTSLVVVPAGLMEWFRRTIL